MLKKQDFSQSIFVYGWHFLDHLKVRYIQTIFGILGFFQKTNKRIRFFSLTVLKTNLLVCFLEESEDTKKYVLSKLSDLYLPRLVNVVKECPLTISFDKLISSTLTQGLALYINFHTWKAVNLKASLRCP